MLCPEWARLLEFRHTVSENLTNAVEATCGLDRPQFDQVMGEVELVRDAQKAAEKALHDHERQHGCQAGAALQQMSA